MLSFALSITAMTAMVNGLLAQQISSEESELTVSALRCCWVFSLQENPTTPKCLVDL